MWILFSFHFISFIFCLQDTENENFENWFDPKEVVSNKRGQIAQLIRKTFSEKNFQFPIVSSQAEVKNPQVSLPDSSTLNHHGSHIAQASSNCFFFVQKRQEKTRQVEISWVKLRKTRQERHNVTR